MFDLSKLGANELFIRVYYNPTNFNEDVNRRTIMEISSRLATICHIANSELQYGRDIGVKLINGGVARKDFKGKGQLYLVFNEAYAYTCPFDFYLIGEKLPFIKNYNKILARVCESIAQVPNTTYQKLEGLYTDYFDDDIVA